MYPERDHGLGMPPDMKPVGFPRAVLITDEEILAAMEQNGGCPSCHCNMILEVKVDMESATLRGGRGVGRYLGCPACPWASPMMVVSDTVSEEATVGGS